MTVLELCCFEWFQNLERNAMLNIDSFRAVLFRMVPKPLLFPLLSSFCFRAVLFRMVPKRLNRKTKPVYCFRAVLFRMVPKP